VYCYGCLKGLEGGDGAGAAGVAAGGQAASLVLRCGQCRQLFCFECDAFIHESLHNCPGCECCPAAGGVAPEPAM
jgi:transcription initiation factor TFIIH subunit 2